jgi:hypothetical protein
MAMGTASGSGLEVGIVDVQLIRAAGAEIPVVVENPTAVTTAPRFGTVRVVTVRSMLNSVAFRDMHGSLGRRLREIILFSRGMHKAYFGREYQKNLFSMFPY